MAATEVLCSINPATEEVMQTFEPHSPKDVEQRLALANDAFCRWRKTCLQERVELATQAGKYLRENKLSLARIITQEMGKPIVESEAEIDKCAMVCDYYGDHAERFLKPDYRSSNASKSYVDFVPLGIILGVMPWNFPFWQVFRFAVPALMAGNTVVLKHASNVSRCALAIERVFEIAGFPKPIFNTLLLPTSAVEGLISDPRIAAVTLTGSDTAGRAVASQSGRALKKTVLELGGSDPFIVLDDADLEAAVGMGLRSRYQNTGQSCIAAKRFIVVDAVFNEFQQRFVEGARQLRVGDPLDGATQIGPLARKDLLDGIERQVSESVRLGADLLLGGERRPTRGYYFEPTVLGNVTESMPVAREETFGPVAALIRVPDAEQAIRVGNDSPYGLGASLWTSNLDRACAMAGEIEAGQVFINGMVASDPRLPFGGTKRSGYGRELSNFGILEFVNVQTVWVGPDITADQVCR